ncbi:MAG: phospholipase D family protein [Pseudomonadota bacterium]
MKANLYAQLQSNSSSDSFGQTISTFIQSGRYKHCDIAVAYATVSGVRRVLNAFDNVGLQSSRWLFGLDDFVTQPGAIDLVCSVPNSSLRVVPPSKVNLRFHPKLYHFESTEAKLDRKLVVGSANLTASAFSGNTEAFAVLSPESSSDEESINRTLTDLWKLGTAPDEEFLKDYQRDFERASAFKKQHEKERAKFPEKILDSDDAELDPSLAKICWIECGNITAMGRELEIKAEQGLFFRLPVSGSDTKELRLNLSDGSTSLFKMKYQGNHMWRLQMNNNIPEVQSGLRPTLSNGKLGRSPYVAVFTRKSKGNSYDLRFMKLDSDEFKSLEEETIRFGTFGQTTARKYGWSI